MKIINDIKFLIVGLGLIGGSYEEHPTMLRRVTQINKKISIFFIFFPPYDK